MSKNKSKEYGYFNFPNQLDAVEQYYSYLHEFNFIPKEMHPGTVKTIFDAAARDFIEGFLEYKKFIFILESLFYGYVNTRTGLNRKMENMMDDITCKLDNNSLTEKVVKEKLEEYFNQE